ncbi:hypothetical protein [Peribacillus simplex]|uniref:hypothetical protein n=1 Tax=Peribacillus simplex TaxID=1478 RepID=UPI00333B3C95
MKEMIATYQRFGFRSKTEFGIYASKKNPPPSVENLMAMELCEVGMQKYSGEVDYSIYNALTH